jgi:hypothetical protein
LWEHRTACDLNSAQGLSWGHIELGKTLLIVRTLLFIQRGFRYLQLAWWMVEVSFRGHPHWMTVAEVS